MKRLLLLKLFITVSFASFAQNDYPAFGKADLKELQMKECAFEKEAGAMKLMDFQETEISINYDLKIEINRRIRIKIFTKAGADAANIIIPYIKRNKSSKVNDITAYIYNLDSTGKIITQKLEKKQILREKAEEGLSKVAFTFPNVKPGSVIEYRFTHSEKNVMHLEPWFFQSDLPTALSVCRFEYPNDVKFDFRFITQDSVVQKYSDNTAKIFRTFTLQQIPSFHPEPMMSSVKDNLQRIEFAFLPKLGRFDFLVNDANRWGIFNLSLLYSPFFGLQIMDTISGTKKIIDSAKKITVLQDRINFIYQSVRNQIRWNDNQSFYADDLSEVWQLKTGNSAEINLAIVNLLKKSDIPCYPILVSTRGNGRTDPEFISLGQFNSVDVLIIDSTGLYVLDGTQKYISYKTPPYNILNRSAFIIDTLKSRWIYITDDRALSRTVTTIKAELNKTGELKGDAYISFYDHSKASRLEEKNEKEKEDEYKEFIEKESADIVIDSLIEDNAEDELQPLINRFGFTYKLSNTDSYFFLDPFFLSNFRKNPFNDSLRRTDIDMGSNQSFTLHFHLTVADDFEIDDLPQSLLIRADDSSMLFKRQILRQGNVLVFRSSFDIQRTVFGKDEYQGIRDFFRKIYTVFNDQLVLKKKAVASK